MKHYPMGFWNYTKAGYLGPEAVKDWAELGMTVALSPHITEGCDKQAIRALLDACGEYGIKMIFSDYRARWTGASDDPAGYEKRFREAYEEFGHHPAAFGFHVGDEPSEEKQFADCVAAHKIQLAVAPELTPHLNFLSYWDGQEHSMLHAPSFADWAKKMAADADLKILCYDLYTQMNPGEDGVHKYFKNLQMFASAAEESGIEPWTTLLSVGHFRYRVPNEDDLRWQVNTAAASGMRGILWFFLYERTPMSNYRLPPIDEFGERTETFGYLSRVNRHFMHQFGDFFMESKHLSTYHIVKSYGGYPLYEEGKTDETLLNVTSEHGLPGIVSFFVRNGRRHVALVNNSMTESGLFNLHVPKDTPVFERLNWDGGYDDLKTANHDAYYAETATEKIGGDWLAPGQLKVYRIG